MNNGLEHTPRKLAVISRGKTSKKFSDAYAGALDVDQVWATNKMYFEFPDVVDVLWAMDDIHHRLEPSDPVFVQLLRTVPVPIVTSRAYPDFMFSCEYPIDDVMDTLVDPKMIFNCRTTIDWLLAYAWSKSLDIHEIHFFGLDGAFKTVDPQRHANTLGWLFLLRSARVELYFQPESEYYEFFDGQISHERGLYGYDPKPDLFGHRSEPDPSLDSQASKMWMANESNKIKARYRPTLED